MTNYTITPANSRYATASGEHAFFRNSAGLDGLVVQQGAFLAASGDAGVAALLEATGAWNVRVDGTLASVMSMGLVLDVGNSGASAIAVGPEGSISGYYGIAASSAMQIVNAGVIAGHSGFAVGFNGSGAHGLANAGVLEGGILAPASVATTETVTNSGTIDGSVELGAGADSFANVRTVGGVAVSGTVRQVINMGSGNDRLLGGAKTELVSDGLGADSTSLGGGNDTYFAVGAGPEDGNDTVAGGTGTDLYDARNFKESVLVNLDTVAHDLSPLVPGAARISAGTAFGSAVSGAVAVDRLSGFENASGGLGNDVIYGSGATNLLRGWEGADTLMGYDSGDRLDGGAGTDTLVGGGQRDDLIGGAGADIFSFVKASDSGTTSTTRDVIRDFENDMDRIDLRVMDAKAGTAANEAFTFLGTNVAFTGQSGQLRSVWTAQGQRLEADLDGDRDADFSVAILDTFRTVDLGVADFLL
jgi:Ca2+-binding RTX toxin-like protein